MNEVKKKPLFFRFIKGIVRLVYRKYKIEMQEDLLAPGNIYVSNHSQLHGPLGQYLYFPQKRLVWVIGQMCNRKEVTAYAMEDFWRDKKAKWFYKLFCKTIVAPLGSYIFSKADAIPVYKDVRLRKTIALTMQCLDEGNDVIIFPECRHPYNKYINQFQRNFIDIARPYTKKTNKPLFFYPMYTCHELKKILIGKPIKFDQANDIDSERTRICNYLQEEIVKLGDSLPNHTIIPYINMKKKYYKKSKE